MKRILTTSIFLMLTMVTLLAAGENKDKHKTETDSTSYVEINGKVIDAISEAQVIFATVFVSGTSIATVSNTDGEFILKIPKGKESGYLSVTHLGYKNKEIKISDLNRGGNLVKLTAVTLPIDEVVIRSIDPLTLIYTALNNIKNNYSSVPEMQTSFYRETIKQNRKYVSVSEAVMDIYKAPYKTTFDSDRIKIYKGRKSINVKKMDTLIVKLKGGPRTSLILDVVKNPGDVLDREVLQYYNFKLSGVTSIDNRETYVISFDQKNELEFPLYSGNIYIDIESNAFAGFDFGLSEKGLPYASEYLVTKKPAGLSIDVKKGHYLVRYRKDANAWYLNYVRSEIAMQSKWKRKLFKTDINIMLEMAITDRDKENIEKFPSKESAKRGDIFVEQVSNFEDKNFWGEYNTIKPDESIEIAIENLNRKLKRR